MTLTQITEKGIKDGEIVNADINASAAIAQSKLNLSISNNEVNTSASIAQSKLNTFVNTNAVHRIITGSATKNTLNGNANLTYNGVTLKNQVAAENGTIAQFELSGQTNNPALLIKADESDSKITFRAGATTNVYPKIAFDMGTVGDALTILNDGKVGIGTTSPGGKLSVFDSSSAVFRLETPGVIAIAHSFDGTDYTIANNDGSNGHPIIFGSKTAGGETMRLASDGKIHMNYAAGTSAGADRLNIMGGGDGITIARSTANASDGNILGNINFHSYMSGSYHDNAEAKIQAIADSGQSGSSAPTHLDFYTKKSGVSPGASPTLSMRIKSAGNVEISDGNLELASGHGINFHNYGSGTNINSNLLDDYEEGTFSPSFTMTGGGESLTYSVQQGIYTKIGETVFIEIYIALTGINSNGTGSLRISGLPFTKTSAYGGVNISYLTNLNNVQITHALVDISSTNIFLYTFSGSSVQNATVAGSLTTGTNLMVNGTYRVP